VKIKSSITITIATALVFVVLAQIYFKVGLPLLNVLYNPAVVDPSETGGSIIIGGDDIFDTNDPFYRTPQPSATQNPGESTPTETSSPTSTPSQHGIIEAATEVAASTLKFAEGTKNILLLGINSDDNLADTIIIVNIDEKNKQITLVSVPRDTYVPHSESVKQAMKEAHYLNATGSFKLNAVLNVGSMILDVIDGKFNNAQIDYLCAVLSRLLPGCEIDDYCKVDFDGFMSIIDVMGGVKITSPEDMYKTKDNNTYLYIRKGENFLNAEDALFYVRYRTRLNAEGENTQTGGDDYRKTNQLNFIVEVSKQFFTAENLTIPKFTGMLEVLKGSVFHSVTLSDLNTYLPIGLDFANGEYNVRSYTLSGTEIDPFGDHASYILLN